MQGRQNNIVGTWRMKDWAGHLAIAALLIGLIVWVRDDIADLRIQVQADIASLRTENAALRTEVKADIAELRTEVQADIADLRNQISDLQQRMARVEGLVEGLRPYIASVSVEDAELSSE